MSLIDKEYYIGAMEESKRIHGEYSASINNFINSLKSAPTVDAVEVVRCKDCKHRFTHTCGVYYGTTNFTDFYLAHGDDFYCSYGERKEAGE